MLTGDNQKAAEFIGKLAGIDEVIAEVFPTDKAQKISETIKLSRATMRTIKQNLFWAFIYNIIGIPVAAGALYPFFGITLNPIFAGLAMSLSSVSVVSNSLRLRWQK